MKQILSFLDKVIPGISDEEAGRIEAQDLKDLMKSGHKITLLDVRTPMEFRDGHIPGSLSVPMDELRGQGPFDGRVVVYCASGVRSRRALKILNEDGTKDAVDLRGGISAWVESGGEFVKGRK